MLKKYRSRLVRTCCRLVRSGIPQNHTGGRHSASESIFIITPSLTTPRALDPSTVDITYVVYDNDNNPDYGPRRMGMVILQIQNLTSDQLVDSYFPLIPSSAGDTTSGSLHLTVLLSERKAPGYEVIVIVVGLLLLVLSLVWGSYVWRKPRRTRKAKARFGTV